MLAAEFGTKLEVKMQAAEAGKDILYLGDAIGVFLRSKRSGGRSEKTVDDYKTKGPRDGLLSLRLS